MKQQVKQYCIGLQEKVGVIILGMGVLTSVSTMYNGLPLFLSPHNHFFLLMPIKEAKKASS